MHSADLLLRFAGVTILTFIAILWSREFGRRPAAVAVALFCFGIVSYLLCPLFDRLWSLGPLEVPFFFGCFGAAVFFYLMSRAIFDDRFQFRLWHLGLLAVMELLGAWHRLAEQLLPEAWAQPVSANLPLVLHQLASLAITLSALFLAFHGRADDLVEKRRRFRDFFVGISGAYILLVVGTEIVLQNRAPHPVLELANVTAIFFISFAFALAMTRLRPAIEAIVPGAAAPAQPPGDSGEEKLLAALTQLMQEQFKYRQEGLTIGQLADELATQEYRLRRLINGAMGYRNFSEFLNRYRIDEVCARLSDPACAKLPILTIALESGYASLGPFNRAFKEITGTTPKNYRSRHVAKPETGR